MYLLEMALNLLLCGFRLFMFCPTRYHTDLEKMDTECWKLLVEKVFSLKVLIIIIQKL